MVIIQLTKRMPKASCLCVFLLMSGVALGSARSLNKKPKAHKVTSARSCRLLDLKLEQNFDLKRFEGKWYGTFKTSIGDSLLSYFAEIYDPRIIFTLNADGSYDLRAYGSKFYGGWCPKGKGHAKMPLPSEPERMTMYFDTRIGRQVGMKPGWILKTDYINYAILYSCWKENSDGTCNSDNTYVAIIQRRTKALDSSKLDEIKNTLKGACVDPIKLSPITHYGYCSNTGKDL